MIRVLAVLSVAGLALAGCSSNSSYFTDATDDTEPQRRTSMFGSMLTMTGVIPAEQKKIAYQPRSPLAMPSQAELRAPEDASAVEAAVNFPKDHDEADRERRAALRELGDGVAANPDDWDDAGMLTAEEAARFRRAGGGQRRRATTTDMIEANRTKSRIGVQSLRERALGRQLRRKTDPVLTAEGAAEPRRYLIQPPDEYRAPADTASLPERGDIEHSKWLTDQLYRGSTQKVSVFDR